jgi:hypothetical protein
VAGDSANGAGKFTDSGIEVRPLYTEDDLPEAEKTRRILAVQAFLARLCFTR